MLLAKLTWNQLNFYSATSEELSRYLNLPKNTDLPKQSKRFLAKYVESKKCFAQNRLGKTLLERNMPNILSQKNFLTPVDTFTETYFNGRTRSNIFTHPH